MPEEVVYKITQTRTVEIIAHEPADAADIARYLFRGEEKPKDGPWGYTNKKIRIVRLEVEELGPYE